MDQDPEPKLSSTDATGESDSHSADSGIENETDMNGLDKLPDMDVVSQPQSFRPQTWSALQQIADYVGRGGRTLAPSDVAAILSQDGVTELEALILKTSRRSRGGDP
jgi:hypothetical protein